MRQNLIRLRTVEYMLPPLGDGEAMMGNPRFNQPGSPGHITSSIRD
jgi:hypothetical protein